MKLNCDGFNVLPGMQTTALEKLAKTNAKYVLLSAPVGSGKSYLGMFAARGAGSAFIVSHQNNLLDQYERNFKNVPVIKGMSHYACRWAGLNRYGDAWTCSDVSKHEAHRSECRDYIPARDAFWRAPISVTNLHYAMFAEAPKGADPSGNCS